MGAGKTDRATAATRVATTTDLHGGTVASAAPSACCGAGETHAATKRR